MYIFLSMDPLQGQIGTDIVQSAIQTNLTKNSTTFKKKSGKVMNLKQNQTRNKNIINVTLIILL